MMKPHPGAAEIERLKVVMIREAAEGRFVNSCESALAVHLKSRVQSTLIKSMFIYASSKACKCYQTH